MVGLACGAIIMNKCARRTWLALALLVMTAASFGKATLNSAEEALASNENLAFAYFRFSSGHEAWRWRC